MARDSLKRLGVAAAAIPVNPVELLADLMTSRRRSSRTCTSRSRRCRRSSPPTAPIRSYGLERDRAARVAREAVALGLEKRRVRIDELTRHRIVRVLLATLRDPELGLSAEQLEAAPKVAARLFHAGRSRERHPDRYRGRVGALPAGGRARSARPGAGRGGPTALPTRSSGG
jgi:hypothetical protein